MICQNLKKMNKYLLIDDLALKGWKSVIEKVVIKTIGNLEVATSFEEAIKKIEENYVYAVFIGEQD